MALAALSYVVIVSLILCVYMYIDKDRAKKKEWRISEKTLLTLGFFGGACGGVLGMYLFRHKTKHNAFAFGLPLMAAIHIFFLVQLFKI
ncbi:DUF1294 domain-containing protein [Solibacillus daqui]|uniref:DUF1294 domain-containing protein n=1 Tax=Solibacillus daqui TaxID=2912187 RepID=UPI002365EA7D|nr:DUF1294 domain-containing protein [Solibacillus daqui]